MTKIDVRPSIKPLLPWFGIAGLLFAAAIVYVIQQEAESRPWWLLVFPILIELWATGKLIGQQATRLTLDGDKLRYQSGLISKTTRTIPIAKLQDVRVDQGVWQRLTGIGNLSIETAGESSRLTMENIDRPQAIADRLLEAASENEKTKRTGL